MKKEFILLNMSPYREIINREAWTVDSVQHPDWKPFYYLFMEQPLDANGISHGLKSFDEIDKSKVWFIPVNVNQGAWDWTSHDLWSSFPSELLHELIHGNAYLIMNNENEYDTRYPFEVFYKMYSKNPIVPTKKLIFLTPAVKAKQIYSQFVKEKNIHSDLQFNIEYSPHIDFTFNDGIIRMTEGDHKLNRAKKYTCLNRTFRWHRPCLVSLLSENNSLSSGYVSLGDFEYKENEEIKLQGWFKFMLKKINEFPWDRTNPLHLEIRKKLHLGINQIHNKIPLIVDKTEFKTNYADWMTTPVDHLRDSYFSVVTSTHFFKWQEESPGWNEKEWKPILANHPFIIVNRPHILKHMRSIGFLTFSRWFDESYDDIEDDWTRLHAISQEILRLSKLTNQEWDTMIAEMSDVLEYNRKVLICKRWDNLFYSSDLKNLLTYL